MGSKVQYFIEAERELSQSKHWLRTIHKISIEEFVAFFKVYEAEKVSGKESRDTLHFETLRDTSKIDVIICKTYKKEFISKLRSETDERQVLYLYSTSQRKLLDKVTEEIEALNVTN